MSEDKTIEELERMLGEISNDADFSLWRNSDEPSVEGVSARVTTRSPEEWELVNIKSGRRWGIKKTGGWYNKRN